MPREWVSLKLALRLDFSFPLPARHSPFSQLHPCEREGNVAQTAAATVIGLWLYLSLRLLPAGAALLSFKLWQQSDQFFSAPRIICQSGFHCWCNAKRLVPSALDAHRCLPRHSNQNPSSARQQVTSGIVLPRPIPGRFCAPLSKSASSSSSSTPTC